MSKKKESFTRRTVVLFQRGNESLVAFIRYEPTAGVIREVEIVRKTGEKLRLTATKNAVFSAHTIMLAEDVGCLCKLLDFTLDLTEDDRQEILDKLKDELAKGSDATMVPDKEPDVMEVFDSVCRESKRIFEWHQSYKEKDPRKNAMLSECGVDIVGRTIRVRRDILAKMLEGTGFTVNTFRQRLQFEEADTGKKYLLQANGDSAHYEVSYSLGKEHIRAFTFLI